MDNFIVAVEDQSSLGDGLKNVAPFKLSKQKRKEKRKKSLAFFYIRKVLVSCLTIPCYVVLGGNLGSFQRSFLAPCKVEWPRDRPFSNM